MKQSNPAVRVIGVEPEWENEAHLVLEPAGALGLAAAVRYAGTLPAGPVVVVASGGNTTLSYLHQLQALAE